MNVVPFIIEDVKRILHGAEAGHDWEHIRRVHRLALTLHEQEGGNRSVIELAALLHDIADSKFHHGDEEIGPRKAREIMETRGVSDTIVDHVEAIIRNISFKGGQRTATHQSLELDIVQDADRLDALGAIGIARTFHYGGFKNRLLYDPSVPAALNMTPEEYKKSTAPTLNHFYEKLLLLKDRMNTKTGKRLASERHQYMEEFVQRFLEEWGK
jgi:uncharacterized protein